LVQGVYADGSAAPEWDMNAMVAAGGIKSSSGDMAKFILAQFSRTDRSVLMIQNITHQIDEKNYIGLGWDIRRTESGAMWFLRPGGTRGYECCVAMDPKEKKGVVVLSNLSSIEEMAINVQYLCLRLMESL
jgi:CubicO group peptidase (beta-lactamase class C family)